MKPAQIAAAGRGALVQTGRGAAAVLSRFRFIHVAWALLAVWAAGLVVSAVQLDAWRAELTRSLVQLAADAQVRARVGERRDKVQPEYFRAKALSLISAIERTRQDTVWSMFVPGTWRMFDDLEERVARRIEIEFGEIVLETIRRELVARTAQLTGAPFDRSTAELQPGQDCRSPVATAGEHRLTTSVEDLPEYIAARDYVAQLAQLDRAVQAYLALQQPAAGADRGEELRLLVRYTLGAELPGEVSRSVAMFRTPADQVNLQPVTFLSPLQWASRCSLYKAMSSLHVRLLQSNDLLATERSLTEHSAAVFGGAARLPFTQALERYKAVAGLLRDQESLLASGRHGWMRRDKLQLGEGYDGLMGQIAQMRVLGPDVVTQLNTQSGLAFAGFREQFHSLFGRTQQPGIVWDDASQRFALSQERQQLRDGLEALLAQPFMAVPEDDTSAPGSWYAAVADAQGLAESRKRWVEQDLNRFPESARAPMGRMVDAYLSQRVHDKAIKALKASQPADFSGPFDSWTFREQRQQLAQIQKALQSMGGSWYAQRLAAAQAEELVKRAESYLASAGATDVAGPQWAGLVSELGQDGDKPLGSARLGEMERYLVSLGPSLNRENCAAKLAASMPTTGGDAIATRHVELHNLLANRCNQMRGIVASAGVPAAVAGAGPAPAPMPGAMVQPGMPAAGPMPAVLNQNGLQAAPDGRGQLSNQ